MKSKTIVLGAGVVGVTTAWNLLQSGHEVVLIDRNNSAASEASYANAGLLAPSDAFAWGRPSSIPLYIKSLFNRNWGIRIVPSLNINLISWCLKFIAQCTTNKYLRNTRLKFLLAQNSLKELDELLSVNNVDFDYKKSGILYYFNSKKEFNKAKENFKTLGDLGLNYRSLLRDDLITELNILNLPNEVYGAIYSINCRKGDCRKFTLGLLEKCMSDINFSYHPGETVKKLIKKGNVIKNVITNHGVYNGDNFILCLGSNSRELAKSIGVKVDILPVRGYSVTIPLNVRDSNLIQGIEDGGNFLALNMLGNQLRVSCNAEFMSHEMVNASFNASTMMKSARSNFDCQEISSNIDIHQAFRPMSPSTVPLIGRAEFKNLFFNTGHGHLGWTLACGSARLITDYINDIKNPLLKEIATVNGLIGD